MLEENFVSGVFVCGILMRVFIVSKFLNYNILLIKKGISGNESERIFLISRSIKNYNKVIYFGFFLFFKWFRNF